jgi:hypothetical protein
MPKFDFTKDTVVAGGIDFTKMTVEQLADKMSEGVPAEKLGALAAQVAETAEAEAHLRKYTGVVLNIVMKELNANGAVGIQHLIDAFVA